MRTRSTADQPEKSNVSEEEERDPSEHGKRIKLSVDDVREILDELAYSNRVRLIMYP